jgi:hypothetical protein
VQVADTVLDELGADQLPTVVPLLAVSGEDAVTEEGPPFLVEGLALAVVAELRGQDGLDVFVVGREDDAAAGNTALGRVRRGMAEHAVPEGEVLVCPCRFDARPEKIKACVVLAAAPD